MYYTKVFVGTPPQEFHVDIDTGSDLPWISCANCTQCPQETSLDIEFKYFDVSKSSTGSRLSCKDYSRCSSCSNTDVCRFDVSYEGGSQTSGYMVSDLLSLDPVTQSSSETRATLQFGCSTSRVDFGPAGEIVDGVFGFGPGPDSVVQQFSSQRITPKVFSHCLKGGDQGGGVLVMGEASQPNIVYTPLVPSQPFYTIKMEGVSVNGKSLPIPSTVFSTKTKEGVVIDSGTGFAYLDSEVYEPFMDAISGHVSGQVKSYIDSTTGKLCYIMNSSDTKIFPQVSFDFAGGASLVLRPDDYLTEKIVDGTPEICMGIQKVEEEGGLSVLGELVLRDKIVVYDLYQQRLGFSSSTFNCSLHMDVDTQYGFTNDARCRFSRHDSLLLAATVLFIVIINMGLIQ